jgi:geranylgeranyl diphosphate synthase type II
MDRLIAYMKENRERIDEALGKTLPRLKETPSALHEAMRYSVFAGGKRLRPLLCMMSAEIFGAEREEVILPACSLELVHTYSLIHDDLPAMDDDDYRRGKLSCHKAFGEALGILAGDALLTLAFGFVAQYAADGTGAECARILARAAGHAGMVGGQVLDLEAEGRTAAGSVTPAEEGEATPLERVEAVHQRKTGALLTAAVEMGGVLGGADADARAVLRGYGGKIGLAFQVKDDILDIESTDEAMGKTVGKDEASGKLTYPSVLGLEESKALLRETVMDAKKILAPFGEKALMLRLLADFIAERDH